MQLSLLSGKIPTLTQEDELPAVLANLKALNDALIEARKQKLFPSSALLHKVFLRIGITGEWDTGASQCIVVEAGGKILAHDFAPLSYNKRESVLNPDFIVMGDNKVDWQSIVKYQLGE